MKRIITLLTFFISTLRIRMLSVCTLSVCTLSVAEGYAQLTGDNYPVQAHVYVQRPSLKMPEYFSSTTMLRTDLILKDLTKTTLDVYLGWQITGLGLAVEAGTLLGFVPPNYLTLTKGAKRQLSGAELREYFQPGMLAVSGVGENVIFNGKLPEGFYTLKITAYEAGTGRQVSNTAETFFSVAYALPPVINLPLIGSEQPLTRPQSVLLQWMPRHTATSSNRITYSGKVCEVAEDEDPNIAINGSQNCFTIPAQPGTGYQLKASDLPLKVGKRYAFQVQVTDNNEQLEFQNQGYSEVSWFRFGEACKPPSGLQVNVVAAGRLNVSWNPNPQATGYKLLYRSKNQTEWTEQTTLGTSVSLVSLNPEPDYEFKVITVCEVGNESPESETVTWEGEGEVDEELEDLIKKVLNPLGEPIVSTGPGIERAAPSDPLPETFEDLIPKDPTKIPCQAQLHSYEECSDQHPEGHEVTADKDLPTLKVGDLITIYDYLVVLTEVSGANNIFSGKGLVKMPFLDDKKMPVEFSNVEIKRDKADQNGGCVTAVNGHFRVRTGLTPEQIRQEEIDLIHEVRTNTDPGSIYISRAQVITELGEELTTTGKDLCDGKPITEEAKQSLLKKHTLAKQGLQDWAEDAADLYSELDLDGTAILSRIQALITAFEANIAIINSGEGCPPNPDIKAEMDAITVKIKEDKSKESTDKLPKITDVVVKNITESEATITWKGDKRFTKYLVSYQTQGQGVVVKEVTKSTLLLSQLNKNKKYNFTIKGIAESSDDTFGPEEFSTLKSSFPPITNLASTEIGDNLYKLTWDKNKEHKSYKVEYIDNNSKKRSLFTTYNFINLFDIPELGAISTVIAFDNSKSNHASAKLLVKGFVGLTTNNLTSIYDQVSFINHCMYTGFCYYSYACSREALNPSGFNGYIEVMGSSAFVNPHNGECPEPPYVNFYGNCDDGRLTEKNVQFRCTSGSNTSDWDDNDGEDGNQDDEEQYIPQCKSYPYGIQLNVTRNRFSCNSADVLTLSTDGVLPVTFQIKGEGISKEYKSNLSTLEISDLSKGSYEIMAIDSKGCISPTRQIELFDSEGLNLEANIIDCQNGVELNATCGTPPYLYSIDGTNFSGNSTFKDLQLILANGGFSGKEFRFWVKDSRNVVESRNITIENIKKAYYLKDPNTGKEFFASETAYEYFYSDYEIIKITNLSSVIYSQLYDKGCGSSLIAVEAANARIPIKIDLKSNEGNTISKNTYSTNYLFEGVPDGIYSLSGNDANGCIFEPISNINVTSNHLDFSSTILDNSCISDLVKVRVEISNHVNNSPSSYEYEILVNNVLNKTLVTRQNIDFLEILVPKGNNKITIKEKLEGCSKDKQVNIPIPQTITLTGQVYTDSGENGACADDPAARVNLSLNVEGGLAPYSFSVSTATSSYSGSTGVFSNLENTNMTVSVIDKNGCTASFTYQPFEPMLVIPAAQNAACGANGKINVTVTGGNQPYQYSLNNVDFQSSPDFENLDAGTYTVTVKDAFNCTATAEATVEREEYEITLSVTSENPTCGADGVINMEATGGRGTYQYSIDGINFTTNSTFKNLPGGAYTPTAKDSRECTAETETTLQEPETYQTVEGVGEIAVAAARMAADGDGSITVRYDVGYKETRVKVGTNYTPQPYTGGRITVNGTAYKPLFMSCDPNVFVGFYKVTCTADPCEPTICDNKRIVDANENNHCEACWLEPEEIEKDILIFSNGYRKKGTGLTEHPNSDDEIHTADTRGYWEGIDTEFRQKRRSDVTYYADGHHSIVTSNHNPHTGANPADQPISTTNFTLSMASSFIAKLGKPVTCSSELTRCVELSIQGNSDGFTVRYNKGKNAAGNLITKLKETNTKVKNIIYNIDVVAHSMGFAYAQGIIDGLRNNDEIKDKIKWGGYYIIAPENGCGGTVDPANWKNGGVWQYGSDLGQTGADPLWEQDGVAPQCAVGGLDNSRRAFIPDSYTSSRPVRKTRIVGYKSNGQGIMIPITETYLDYSITVPKNFVESHSIGNYGWIFERGLNDNGYVIPK